MLELGRGRSNLVYNSDEYIDASTRFHTWMADNLFVIGTVGMSPMMFIYRPNIGNIPEIPGLWIEDSSNLYYYAPQFFYK